MNMNLKGIMQTLGAKPGQVVSNPYVRAFAPQPTITEGDGEDHEVSMANNSIDTIIKMATELKAKMGEDEKQIPAWIQDHIAKAENLISQASGNYHEYGTMESVNEASYTVKADNAYQFINGAVAVLGMYSKDEKIESGVKSTLQRVVKDLEGLRKYFFSRKDESVNEVQYPTDLKVGSVIMGQGFTMLKGIEGGKYYKVVAMDDTTATLVPSDKSGNTKGSTKVRHKLDSIEGGIKTAKRGDENGIVVIKESVTEAMGNDKAMLALVDILSNSMEHYASANEFVNITSKIPGFANNKSELKDVFAKYWKVGARERNDWNTKDWLKWLKPFGLEENVNSETDTIGETTLNEKQFKGLEGIPSNKSLEKISKAEKLNIIKAKGNIIDFIVPDEYKSKRNFWQVISTGNIKKSSSGNIVMLMGGGPMNSPSFKNIDDLIDGVDWASMERTRRFNESVNEGKAYSNKFAAWFTGTVLNTVKHPTYGTHQLTADQIQKSSGDYKTKLFKAIEVAVKNSDITPDVIRKNESLRLTKLK